MERQAVISLIVYLNRAISIVPTTGAEWDSVRGAIKVLEGIAGGSLVVAPKPETPASE
jgi:hypothetical protein